MITQLSENILDFKTELATMTELWQPRVVAESDNHIFKLVKVKGEFSWHIHDTSKVLIVFEGSMKIDFREDSNLDNDTALISDTKVLNTGDMYLVPANTNHKPHADDACAILLIEMKSV